MNTEERDDLRHKILEGLKESFRKLVQAKQKEDAELIFSKGGEIIRIKARKIAKSAYQ